MAKDKIQKLLNNISEKEQTPFPTHIPPMLATLVDKPFDEEGWVYEIKWDGFRTLAYINNTVKELKSRNHKPFNEKFYPIHDALSAIRHHVVFDGEIVVLDKKGLPDFKALQTWRSEADGFLVYYIFDLLWLEGYSLIQAPLIERKNLLKAILPNHPMLRLSETFAASGVDFFNHADQMKLEGIIAKKSESTYKPDKRTKDWLKIKTQRFQDVVIGGFTKNKGTSKLFSSLLVGIFKDGDFVSAATVGTGFTAKEQKNILQKLETLIVPKCPFKEPPGYNKPSRFRPNPPEAEVYWVKPQVVAEISFKTIAPDGSFRHPSFKGLREDKVASEVILEMPEPKTQVKNDIIVKKDFIEMPEKDLRKTLLNPTDEQQIRNIEGKELKFTNLSKIFWPSIKVSKRDLLNYYYQVAPFILPYISNRPQTLNRFPNGVNGKSFYQKDVKGKVPGWIETFDYYSHGDKREKNFLVCTDEASLLFLVNLGCIEINPWSSQATTPDNPDWCIIDLDPDQNTFEQVIKAACVTKDILDEIGVEAFCKTSGSTGMHIYIPLENGYTYEDSKEFGRSLANAVHSEIPKFTTVERYIENRNGKMYIDFLQNRPQATVSAPYSVRPKPNATVSMPLHWDEVRKGLKIVNFTIENAIDRIRETGDLFKGILEEKNNLNKAHEKLKGKFHV